MTQVADTSGFNHTGEKAVIPDDDGEIQIEANIDDMNPQGYELLTERLFAAGALDVWLTPIMMKKGRPGTTVSALAANAKRDAVEEAFFLNSTTLGVRVTQIERTKATRRIETVITRWGDVRIKLRGWAGRVFSVAPEYDDCVAIARATGVSLHEVQNEATRIGEVYVGRKIDDAGNLV
jgi:pyridinium-3,5-bisthiocarboxylic acid mononucleotide nickel chelatase